MCSPAIGGEADAVDGLVEVKVVEDGSGDETDQQRGAICATQTHILYSSATRHKLPFEYKDNVVS